MHNLFLLDGMALVYRAHFAFMRSPILTSKGFNTSAVYGFTNTLLDIIDNHDASHIGIAFDTRAPTSRHQLYPEYKAQREAMPEELAAAIPYVKQMCAAFGIPVVELDGYEADDIIGTLAHRADAEGGIHTFMVTPDKDFAQLVSETTTIWKPGRQGSGHELLNVAAIQTQWQIEHPKQVIDILGLWGDASDNIPGVPGIGEKTAKKLVAEFGSVEKLLESTDQLKGKQKENLINFADQARLSKELATIILDVPVELSWDSLQISQRDDKALQSLLTEMEFHSIAKRLYGDSFSTGRGHETPTEDTNNTTTPPSQLKTIEDVEHSYHLVDDAKELHRLIAKLSLASRFCFDLETTSLDPRTCEILGLAFALNPHEAYFIHTGADSKLNAPMVLEKLALVFTSRVEKIGHNLKFDLSVLQTHGCQVEGPFFDTMLVHALVASDQRHSMDYVSESLLGYTPIKLADLPQQAHNPKDDLFSFEEEKEAPKPAKKKAKKKDINMTLIPAKELSEYAAEDADVTLQISELLRNQLEESGQKSVYADIESPLLPVLTMMENEGISLDALALKEIGTELSHSISQLSEDITRSAGREFNLNSPKQLGEILFGEMKLVEKPKKTKTGQFKTDEQTLSSLASKHKIISDILKYREATKLKSTYVDALPLHVSSKTGRVHTHYHQLMTSTGRLASNDPNLQNIPVRSEAGRAIRKAFIPRDKNHTLLAVDYSQIELRIMAALSDDQAMIEDIKNDLDIHCATAARVYGVSIEDVTSDMRRNAKMVNFGIIYGISAFGLSQRLDIPRGEASEIIETYFKQYSGVKNYMDSTIEIAKEKGYVETLSSRRCYIRNINSENGTIRSGAERAAINAPVQGSAADMIKLAMIHVRELLDRENTQTKMLLQVHDELLFDLHLSEQDQLVPKIVQTMEKALTLPHDIQCKVETGSGANWLIAH